MAKLMFLLISVLVLLVARCESKALLAREMSSNVTSERIAMTSSELRKWLALRAKNVVEPEGGDQEVEVPEASSDPREPDEKCERMIDIAFLLDSSDSIGPANFRVMKSYVKIILKNLDLSNCDDVGLIRFTDFANSETYLGMRQSLTDVAMRLDALEGPTQHVPSEVAKSRVDLGLLVAHEIIFTRQFGSRASSDKFLVVITDGHMAEPTSGDEAISYKTLKEKLAKKGIRVLVLVVGEDASIPELLRITPHERNIFPERRLDELISSILSKKRGGLSG